MAVERLGIERVVPYEVDGWELVAGTVDFAVDPAHPANGAIVDLDRAPRGADGCVRYDADFRLIRPTDRPIERLLVVVPNRGFTLGMPFSIGAAAFGGSADAIPAGDALAVAGGWSIAWCGWQWDVTAPTSLGLRAPVALDGGAPITGWVRVEFRTEAPQADKHLSDSSLMFSFAPYPTADLDDQEAVLTVRDYLAGERHVVPRDRWRFAREAGGQPVPDAAHIWLDGGFEPHRIYEVVYRTGHSPVAGTGLLAVRDFASHLRFSGPAPVRHAIGLGVSQCGRFLRQFLYEGRNADEEGRTVFDGLYVDIAGGRRGEFNHRYAQPSVTHTASFGNLPPFTNTELTARARAAGQMPKTFFVNTAWEYWRGDAAQLHTDADGRDLPELADVRTYFVAGVDHIGAAVEMKRAMPIANDANPLGSGLVGRALFTALARWVCEGEAPPDSRVPRVGDGTAVPRRQVLAALARCSSLVLPDDHAMHAPHAVDLGPQAAEGIGRYPILLGEAAPDLVSAVDGDGNEIAGIRLPQLRVPVGVFTGFNPRKAVPEKPAVMLEFVGSFAPLPAGELAARYPDRDSYERQVRGAAAELVDEGFLLPGDLDRAVADAVRLYDTTRG